MTKLYSFTIGKYVSEGSFTDSFYFRAFYFRDGRLLPNKLDIFLFLIWRDKLHYFPEGEALKVELLDVNKYPISI